MIDYNKILSEKVAGLKPSGIRKFFDLLDSMQDVVGLTVGQPDFVTPWHIREAAIESGAMTAEQFDAVYTPETMI